MTDRVISIYETLADVPNDFTGLARVGGDTTNYSILINATKVNGVITRDSRGSSDSIADRPSAAALGKGSWQVGGVVYESDGVNYVDSIASNTKVVALVSDLASIPVNYTTAIVKDALRGGTFNWSATGTVDNGITFAGLTGFWVRQYDNIAVSPDWWGARADNLIGSAATNTTALQAAISSGKKVLLSSGTYYHNGLVVDTTTQAFQMDGAGDLKSILKCSVTGVDNLTIKSLTTGSIYSHLKLSNFGLTGNDLNGHGLNLLGVIWFNIDSIRLLHNGGHGIYIKDTGSASTGTWIGNISNVNSAYNGMDGLYVVGDSGSQNQMNAIYINGGEFASNVNGITMWGTSVSVKDSTIEANSNYGINLQNYLVAAPIQSATSLAIEGNYFEANLGGHIYAKTDPINSGAISGMIIKGNYFAINTATVIGGIGHKGVLFVGTSSGSEYRNVEFSNNQFAYIGTAATVNADFGNQLGYDCVVSPAFTHGSSSDLTLLPQKYIGLGRAKFNYISSVTIPAYWDIKNATGITYTSSVKSDSITVSGSNALFPVSVPLGVEILKIALPVETDSTNYSVTFGLESRAQNTTAYTSRIAPAITGTGTKIVETASLYTYGSTKPRQTLDNMDIQLKITITLTVAGTFFYMGNPTLFYI